MLALSAVNHVPNLEIGKSASQFLTQNNLQLVSYVINDFLMLEIWSSHKEFTVYSDLFLALSEVNYSVASNKPLHTNRWSCNPDVRNSEMDEITISDWLDNYENDDVSNFLLQFDCSLQNLSTNKIMLYIFCKFISLLICLFVDIFVDIVCW